MRSLRLLAIVVVAACLSGCLNVNVPNFKAPDVDVDVNAPDRRRPPDEDRRAGYRANFGAYDSLAHVGRPVDLAAWLVSAETNRPVSGATIGFYWEGKVFARAVTGADGLATAAWTPAAAGTYAFSVRVLDVPPGAEARLAKSPAAEMVVSARDPKEPIVLVDLDHCVFASSAKRAWLGSTKAKPGAAGALARISRRFPVVYMTRSSAELSPATRGWLSDNGFPDGPVLLAESPPSFGDGRKYKSARPADLLSSFPGTAAAVCGSEDAARALAARGVKTFLLTSLGDGDDPDDLRDDARKIASLDRSLNVVTRWDQAARGILAGQRYPPGALARELKLRASRLEDREDRD